MKMKNKKDYLITLAMIVAVVTIVTVIKYYLVDRKETTPVLTPVVASAPAIASEPMAASVPTIAASNPILSASNVEPGVAPIVEPDLVTIKMKQNPNLINYQEFKPVSDKALKEWCSYTQIKNCVASQKTCFDPKAFDVTGCQETFTSLILEEYMVPTTPAARKKVSEIIDAPQDATAPVPEKTVDTPVNLNVDTRTLDSSKYYTLSVKNAGDGNTYVTVVSKIDGLIIESFTTGSYNSQDGGQDRCANRAVGKMGTKLKKGEAVQAIFENANECSSKNERFIYIGTNKGIGDHSPI